MRSARTGGITKNTNLGELVQHYPELVEVLVNDYGLHCVGCMAAAFETLEDGARAHGFSGKEMAKMVKRLNEIVKKKPLLAYKVGPCRLRLSRRSAEAGDFLGGGLSSGNHGGGNIFGLEIVNNKSG